MTRRPTTYALTALLAAAMLALGACGEHREEGKPVREGLSTELDGVYYTVFITRQLNLKSVEDQAYYTGKEAPVGSGLYGVFIEACNYSDREASASQRFEIHDTQGNEYAPKPLPRENPFAYHGGKLPGHDCYPTKGSLAQLGPTSGSMLLFQLPISSTENRPLELVIRGEFDAAAGKPKEARIELDL